MPVNIVENWSDITGSIRQISISGIMKGYYELEIQVDTVAPVPGYRNLLEGQQGQVRIIMVPELLFREKHPCLGDRILCRVRVTSHQRIVIHPDHFRIQSMSS